MIKYVVNIKRYWKVIFLFNIDLGEEDTGFTHSDFKKKTSIVGVSVSSSHEQFFNTLIHEIKHVQSHICSYYNVNEDSEPAAYLVGFIAQDIYKIIRKFII